VLSSIGSQAINQGGSLLAVWMLASRLSVSAFGAIVGALGATSILGTVVGGLLAAPSLVILARNDSSDSRLSARTGVITLMVLLTLPLILSAGTILVALPSVFQAQPPTQYSGIEQLILVLIAATITALVAMNAVYQMIAVGLGMPAVQAILALCRLLGAAGPIVFLNDLQPQHIVLFYLLAGNLIMATASLAILCLATGWRPRSVRIAKSELSALARRFATLGVPQVFNGVAAVMVYSLTAFLLTNAPRGAFESGVYGLSLHGRTIVVFVPTALSPLLVRYLLVDTRQINRISPLVVNVLTCSVASTLTVIVVFGLLAWAPESVVAKYSSLRHAVQLQALVGLVASLGVPLSNYFLSSNQSKNNLIVNTVFALTSSVMLYMFRKLLTAELAACVHLASFALVLFLQVALYNSSLSGRKEQLT